LKNTVLLNNWAGILIGTGGSSAPSYNNTIYRNIVKNNTDHGIDLRKFVYYTNVSRNIITDNDWSGIALRINNVSYNTIWGNLIKNNKQYGVNTEIGTASNNLIYQNSFIGNLLSHGRDFGGGNNGDNAIMGNYWDNYSGSDSIFYDGIGDSAYSYIKGTASSQDDLPLVVSPIHVGDGISIDDTGSNAVNWTRAVELNFWCYGSGTYSDPFIIEDLNINTGGSTYGITIYYANKYFLLKNNNITAGSKSGVVLYGVHNGTIFNNNISNNNYGIWVNFDSSNLTIEGNLISYNTRDGIYFFTNNDSFVINNTIIENSQSGIYIAESTNNNITKNIIADNNNYGLYLRNFTVGSTIGNIFYNNAFNNTQNARDDITSFDNAWDNGTIGNYWDDYISGGGYDLNDDGIGDIVYTILGSAGAYDSKPLCDDGDDNAPKIEMILPSNNTFHSDPPTFLISVYDYYSINTTWYSVYNGTNWSQNNNFVGNSVPINPTLWNALNDGIVLIKFSVNDSVGHYNSTYAIIMKDTILPLIKIISPSDNQFYGVSPPNFTVELSDVNLNKTWYVINSGATRFYFTQNSTINNTAWLNSIDGPVNISFYANDMIGNINSLRLIVRKDSSAPSIEIITPTNNQFFGSIAPNFTVEISDIYLNKTWYVINSGATKHFFTQNDTIDDITWQNLAEGTVNISFYANDSLNHVNSKYTLIIKDTIVPNIDIISPLSDQVFSSIPPSFNVEISDPNLDKMWYIVNNEPIKYYFTQNDTIDNSAWQNLPNGAVNITFFANDLVGNEFSDSITIFKDTSTPQESWFIWVIRAVIGGVISAFTGIIIKIIYSRRKKKKELRE